MERRLLLVVSLALLQQPCCSFVGDAELTRYLFRVLYGMGRARIAQAAEAHPSMVDEREAYDFVPIAREDAREFVRAIAELHTGCPSFSSPTHSLRSFIAGADLDFHGNSSRATHARARYAAAVLWASRCWIAPSTLFNSLEIR